MTTRQTILPQRRPHLLEASKTNDNAGVSQRPATADAGTEREAPNGTRGKSVEPVRESFAPPLAPDLPKPWHALEIEQARLAQIIRDGNGTAAQRRAVILGHRAITDFLAITHPTPQHRAELAKRIAAIEQG